MGKYYAVKKGRKTGIFTSWPETQQQVTGFPGAVFKGFKTQAEAQQFLSGDVQPAKHLSKSVAHTDNDSLIIGYTDGGTRNTGNVKGGHVKSTDKAAWAFRLELPDGVISDSEGEWGATNNRMEIMALIKALEALIQRDQQQADITMVLDSKYVLNAIEKHWLAGWKRRGWRRSGGELLNAELWRRLDSLLSQFTQLSFVWTKGHADNDGNVFVDELLNKTMDHMKPGVAQTKHAPKHSTELSQQPRVKKTPNQPATTKATPSTPKMTTSETKQSVNDIQKALEQLDLFKDL
ncbi:ribonuclease H [Secundilactobacillus odoratitofui DSM 19909 = JCM 15043]|uniref:Ribonuclease H n=1 Tax=Secundilactobacillus odoratitofui DSM 19909 = JCM 15043 TaxID=1423776 RepID=A0A0R1LTK7_9LACO|nr:ribonuclease H [Secundilactobacillus odoratitofui DSM 19909 = JCM 15043]